MMWKRIRYFVEKQILRHEEGLIKMSHLYNKIWNENGKLIQQNKELQFRINELLKGENRDKPMIIDENGDAVDLAQNEVKDLDIYKEGRTVRIVGEDVFKEDSDRPQLPINRLLEHIMPSRVVIERLKREAKLKQESPRVKDKIDMVDAMIDIHYLEKGMNK